MRSLFIFLQGLFGTGVARLLSGAGLGLASFAGLTVAITTALSVATSYASGLPSDVLNLLLISGFGPALSLIGAAMLTRAGMDAAGVAIRKKP